METGGGAVPELGRADRGGTRLRWAIEEAVRRASGVGGIGIGGIGGAGGTAAADRGGEAMRGGTVSGVEGAPSSGGGIGRGGRPVSGVVVMSDGRSPESTGGSWVEGLARSGLKVHVVPTGAAALPLDYFLARVEAPEAGFVGDVVPVTVVVEKVGGEDQAIEEQGGKVVVRLVDTPTGEVLDERDVAGEQLGQPVRLEGRSEATGSRDWRVEVEAVGTGGTQGAESSRATAGEAAEPDAEAAPDREPRGPRGELNVANNVAGVVVEMIDRPIRVLYVEGAPRWEYRYLKNMLIREASIDSSVWLLSADRGFAQEGDTPITRLPATPEEWRRYDVVIVGDVPAEIFGPEQRQQLHDLVAQRGAGVMWLGGPGAMPAGYGGTMLADLLPMREVEAVSVVPAATLRVRPTEVAEGLSVLRLAGTAQGRDRRAEGARSADGVPAPWGELAGLRWVQDVGAMKPSVEVLAVGEASTTVAAGQPEGSGERGGVPVVMRLRFGAGQSVYVATDETWRWRYGRGEVYFERFWVSLVRMLGRGAATRGDEAVRLTVSNRRVPAEGSVVVELTVEDQTLLARELTSVRVEVRESEEEKENAVEGPNESDEANGFNESNGADGSNGSRAADVKSIGGGGQSVGELVLRAVRDEGPGDGDGAGGALVYRGLWRAAGWAGLAWAAEAG